jgi:hypothetical protein
MIVDAQTAFEVERVLSERYYLPVDRAVSFKSFLKSNNEIVVLKSGSTNQAKVVTPSVTR